MSKVPVRKIIVYAIYILLFSCIQISFSSQMSFWGQIPDLMFVFATLSGYLYGFGDGAAVALITGLIRDCFTPPIITSSSGDVVLSFGIGMLVLFAAAAVGSSFFTERLKRSTAFGFVTVIFTTLVYKLAGHIVIALWTAVFLGGSYSMTTGEIFVQSVLPQIALNLIAAIPVMLLLKFPGPYRKKPAEEADDVIKYGDGPWLTI